MKLKRNDTITQGEKTYTVTDFLGVLGKMRYMAPEIVRGDKTRSGSVQLSAFVTEVGTKLGTGDDVSLGILVKGKVSIRAYSKAKGI